MEKLKIIKEIGSGSFATVFSAKLLSNLGPLEKGEFVAVKKIAVNKFETLDEMGKLENEIMLMQKLNHQNIVRLYEVQRTADYYYLIMEYCEEGDLMHFLKRYTNGLPSNMLQNFAYQIGQGLNYLYSNEVIHRDLKPHNILIKGTAPNIVLKIADFGLAKILRPADLAETICGSPVYMAPEVLNAEHYTYAVDMWSLGIIFYELIMTQPPFPRAKSQIELIRMLKQHGDSPIEIPQHVKISDDLRNLVSRLLSINPEQRLTLQEYINHPYLRNVSSQEPESVKGRKRSFSFLSASHIPKPIDGERMLEEATEAVNTIITYLNDIQDGKYGDDLPLTINQTTKFVILVTLLEFLVDFLAEARQLGDIRNSLEDSVISQIEAIRDEAEKIELVGVTNTFDGISLLYQFALENAIHAASEEENGFLISSGELLQRSAMLLYPVMFSINRIESSKANQVFSQILTRMQGGDDSLIM